jgi:hypothetical protein
MKQNFTVRKGFLIIFISLIYFQYGCTGNDKHKYQAYLDMKDFVLDDYNRDGGYFLFFETDSKDSIIYLDTYALSSALTDSSNFNDSYFKDLMMDKITLSCGDFGKCFTLSPNIMGEYKRKGFSAFAKVYAKYNEEYRKYTINPTLSYDEKLSVAYFFYLNNFYTNIDCYSYDFVSRREYLMGIPVEESILIEIEE